MSLSVGDIFEDYIESLANLPSEIDQNMHELRSMDEEFQRYREAYAKHKRSYLKMLKTTTLSSPTSPIPTSTVHMTTSRMQLEKDYKTAIQKQDQKIELAMRMYDLVSRHIERIDSQMAQNNITPTTDWMYNQRSNNNNTNTNNNNNHHNNNYNNNNNNYSSSSSNISNHTLSSSMNSRKTSQWDNWHNEVQKLGNKKRTLLHGTTGPRKRTHHSIRPNPIINNGTLMENDIDPNEPRYCYCNQVSFGDMVACDGNNCEKEWFHYSCVGLTEPPAGKWFCDNCATEEGNQKKVKKY